MTADGTAWMRSFAGRRVLVTGHTGFKGAWLCLLLKRLGADVFGLALEPELVDGRNPFLDMGLTADLDHAIGDIRDARVVAGRMAEARPEIVFHLAAQSLVRRSYDDPVGTFASNAMGTAHILDAARTAPKLQAVVVVTSDKCYENFEDGRAYGETDPMGGHDPYSASKGCAELVVQAFQRSFFSKPGTTPLVASARAGNVIGGGDWCVDRLVPDIARALTADGPVSIRNPRSVRPWQHVLEPLRGYLMLGARLLTDDRAAAGGWNFGPDEASHVPVQTVAERLVALAGRGSLDLTGAAAGPHEARHLHLATAKARSELGFSPRLTLDDALALTAGWYVAVLCDGASARDRTLADIDGYLARFA